MKTLMITLLAATSAIGAVTFDADTVDTVKTTVPASAEDAVDAVLSDIDEFVEDAERRINRLHKVALSHRGTAMVYSAASHRLAAEGDCLGSVQLWNVSRELLALARAEESAADAVAELFTAATEYVTVRKVGSDPCGVVSVADITVLHDAVRARVEEALTAERRVNAYSTVVEALVERTKDSMKLGINLLKSDKDKLYGN